MAQPEQRTGPVLVTGGSGFLGGWCVVELLRRGHRVRTTVRDLTREDEVRRVVATEVDAGDRLAVLGADLTDDAGWAEALAGCEHVLHVASPFPPTQPKDADELIVPARDGTLRVLRAALDAGVRRIVVTSSVAAVRNPGVEVPGRPLTEEDWTDPDNPRLSPYVRSKTIAERAAWDLVREAGDPGRLAVVNPGAIIGPLLGDDRSYSLQAIERMLNGMPGLPRLGFSFVDVRDVADLEVRAMDGAEAGGERFIAAEPFMWMADVAAILRRHLGAAAAKVPSRRVPDFVVRLLARFDPEMRSVVGDLGRATAYSDAKARTRLGWSPRPVEESIVDTARSLIDRGIAGAASR
jgi:nucleoside-diphosphate-sugar epimerase